MDKPLVKLSPKVAKIADYVNEKLGPDSMFELDIVLGFVDLTMKDVLQEFLGDPNHDGYRLWFTALVNGYEVEQTPEDKVKEFYQMATDTSKSTIRKTLELLDKKIEGINT